MQDVLMPAQGMAMTEAVLVRWLKEPGEWVAKGEPVAEIETDKANVEVESPAEGRLGSHLVEAGATVPVGAPIAQILDGEEAHVGDAPVATAPSGRGSPPVLPPPSGSPPVRQPASPAPSDQVAEPAHSTIPSPAVPAAPKRRKREEQDLQMEAIEVETHPAAVEVGELLAVEIGGLSAEQLIEWLNAMVLVREFEEASNALAFAGKIPGGIHSAAGQEAVAVGTVRALEPTDIVTSTHRSHHHSLAKGLTPREIMAELYGKVTGCLGGRAGHMHLADFSKGLFGSNGIVGGGLGIAMGAALAADMRGLDQVAVGFFGDGGANTGRVWEVVNLASVWKLPLIVICENNLYAVETHIRRASACPSVAQRASGFGLPAVTVDGQDVATVYRTVKEARKRAVTGRGPTFIEALTYRYEGHNTGDKGVYRTQDEVEEWRTTKDPIQRLRRAMETAGMISEGQFEGMVQAARATVADAVDFAERSPWPDPATAVQNVTGLQVKVRGNV